MCFFTDEAVLPLSAEGGFGEQGGFQPVTVAKSVDPTAMQHSSGGQAGRASKPAQGPSADETKRLFAHFPIMRPCICKGDPASLCPEGRAEPPFPEDQNRNTPCENHQCSGLVCVIVKG